MPTHCRYCNVEQPNRSTFMTFMTWQDVSEASLDERIPFFQSALRKAVENVLVADTDLIAAGAHEQAVTHRIGVYLERHLPKPEALNPRKVSASRITVDAEYNRCGGDPKSFAPTVGRIPKQFRPDLVVHSRLLADFNYLAVEAKLLGRSEQWKAIREEDIAKIEKLVCEGRYLYNLGVLLTICSPKWYIHEKRHAAITLRWFTRLHGWTGEELLQHEMSDALIEVAARRRR